MPDRHSDKDRIARDFCKNSIHVNTGLGQQDSAASGWAANVTTEWAALRPWQNKAVAPSFEEGDKHTWPRLRIR